MTAEVLCLFDPGLPPADHNHVTLARNAPDTSRAAAAMALPASGTRRAQVLAFIAARSVAGATDHETADRLGMPLSSVCARRHELLEAGWVVDSGARRISTYGVPGIVWRLSSAGREAWGR